MFVFSLKTKIWDPAAKFPNPKFLDIPPSKPEVRQMWSENVVHVFVFKQKVFVWLLCEQINLIIYLLFVYTLEAQVFATIVDVLELSSHKCGQCEIIQMLTSLLFLF